MSLFSDESEIFFIRKLTSAYREVNDYSSREYYGHDYKNPYTERKAKQKALRMSLCAGADTRREGFGDGFQFSRLLVREI